MQPNGAHHLARFLKGNDPWDHSMQKLPNKRLNLPGWPGTFQRFLDIINWLIWFLQSARQRKKWGEISHHLFGSVTSEFGCFSRIGNLRRGLRIGKFAFVRFALRDRGQSYEFPRDLGFAWYHLSDQGNQFCGQTDSFKISGVQRDHAGA
jgi:hypothetical protein